LPPWSETYHEIVGGSDAAKCGLAQKLGISEFAERLVENRIDLSVLTNLTDQNLKVFGVVLGDCR
jgi:hypothetical protein